MRRSGKLVLGAAALGQALRYYPSYRKGIDRAALAAVSVL